MQNIRYIEWDAGFDIYKCLHISSKKRDMIYSMPLLDFIFV